MFVRLSDGSDGRRGAPESRVRSGGCAHMVTLFVRALVRRSGGRGVRDTQSAHLDTSSSFIFSLDCSPRSSDEGADGARQRDTTVLSDDVFTGFIGHPCHRCRPLGASGGVVL